MLGAGGAKPTQSASVATAPASAENEVVASVDTGNGDLMNPTPVNVTALEAPPGENTAPAPSLPLAFDMVGQYRRCMFAQQGVSRLHTNG